MFAFCQEREITPIRGDTQDREIVGDKVRNMSADEGIEIIQVLCCEYLQEEIVDFDPGKGRHVRHFSTLEM
jgi:hypothetical protein